ncbi:hypothetical protein Dacsa_0046 [Dactylococcopsis salina PCC 8305]|uniref:CHAT domain-containing protein n=2 Tax=Dactylococcopsis salina TaxID=292566 RepID=K9YRZ6_DACS8|nr:hypothetical protein Dacsa_0046 [Dactylococcopsis salina PCC 8305]
MYKRLFPDDHPRVALSLNNLAGLYSSQGNYSEAVAFLKRGTDVEEAVLSRNLVTGSEQQKRAYLETFSGSTNYPISLHLQNIPNNQDAANLALTTILRRKGRVLDVLGNSLRQLQANSDSQTKALFQELSQVQNQLSQLVYNPSPQSNRQVIQDLETKATNLEAELMNRSAEFRQQVKPVNIADVQKVIPDNAILLEFIQYQPVNPKTNESGSPRYAVYLLRSSGEVQWADLGEAEVIDQKIDRARNVFKEVEETIASTPRFALPQVLAENLAQSYTPAAQELYQQILAPISEMIEESEHLLIAPDSSLNLIPFAGLIDSQNRYLLETHRITYLTSGRDLLRFQLPDGKTERSLLFANPTYSSPGQSTIQLTSSQTRGSNQRSGDLDTLEFGALPGTATEGSAIAQLFPQMQVLTEEAATENALKSSENSRILHIATHGAVTSDQ